MFPDEQARDLVLVGVQPAIVRIASAEDLLGLQTLHCEHPAMPILAVIASGDPEHALRAIELGAKGVAPASLSESELASLAGRLPAIACVDLVIAALQARCARKRDFGLTCREQEVLALLVEGTKTHEIATRLGVSFTTAQTHLKNIYRKLGTGSKAQATAIALRNRLV
jgi:DNA-binding NarL/FixJ family response regulator